MNNPKSISTVRCFPVGGWGRGQGQMGPEFWNRLSLCPQDEGSFQEGAWKGRQGKGQEERSGGHTYSAFTWGTLSTKHNQSGGRRETRRRDVGPGLSLSTSPFCQHIQPSGIPEGSTCKINKNPYFPPAPVPPPCSVPPSSPARIISTVS